MLESEMWLILIDGPPYATLLPFKTYETSLEHILLAINHLKTEDFYEIARSTGVFLSGTLAGDSHRNSMIQLLRELVASYRLEFILLLACEHTNRI